VIGARLVEAAMAKAAVTRKPPTRLVEHSEVRMR
jgi:hypothetical protein